MKDIKITKAIINERDELIVSFICKAMDYNIQEEKLLKQAKNNGDTLDLEVTGLVEGKDDSEIKQLRQTLDLKMKEYARLSGQSFSEELNEFYNRLKIKSRTELTKTQLSQEISSYEDGIKVLS